MTTKTSPTLVLRDATAADAPLLRRWDEDPDMLASDPDDAWNWETELGVVHAWRAWISPGRPTEPC
jgi:aminoglycoside 6'-N-acetyltransferase